MLRVPEANFLQGITSISGRDVQVNLLPPSPPTDNEPPQPPPASLLQKTRVNYVFWTTDVFFGQPSWLAQLNAVLWAKTFYEHFRLAERRPALAHAVLVSLISWSFSNSMLRYLFVDHAVPAMCPREVIVFGGRLGDPRARRGDRGSGFARALKKSQDVIVGVISF